MLTLVSHQEKQIGPISTCEVVSNTSHEFIDELITQIKYMHLEEVWQARLERLTQVLEIGASPKSKHLKAI